MLILGIMILFEVVVISLLIKFKVSKKNIVTVAILWMFIGLFLFCVDEFDLINRIKLKYNNQIYITKKQKEEAIAQIRYSRDYNIFDSGDGEICYILKNKKNSYNYYINKYRITVAGFHDEKILETGTINNKKQLKKIIKRFENLERRKEFEVKMDEFLDKLKNLNSDKSENSIYDLSIETYDYVILLYKHKLIENNEVFLNKMFN